MDDFLCAIVFREFMEKKNKTVTFSMRSQNTCFRQKKQNKWENRVSGPTCQHFSSMFPGLLFLGGTSHGRWNSSRQTPTCRVAPKHRCLWTNWTNLAKTVENVSASVKKGCWIQTFTSFFVVFIEFLNPLKFPFHSNQPSGLPLWISLLSWIGAYWVSRSGH